jgi:hypothetical protein
MSNNLNALDLFKKNKNYEQKIINIFKKILSKCNNAILFSHKKKQNDLLYKVPEIILGYPSYNLDECICYLIIKLRKNNFYVKYIYPNMLFIAWYDEELLNKIDKEKEFIKIEHDKEFPIESFIEKYKKTSTN